MHLKIELNIPGLDFGIPLRCHDSLCSGFGSSGDVVRQG
jgi:hypothetical protein